MSDTGQIWKPNETEAFCWQPKSALQRIREALDASNTVASGIAVYVALTEVASDKRSETFQSTHAYLAGRSGTSRRTVLDRIKDLVEIGLIKVVVPNLKAPSTFTLLHVTQPLHSDVKPLPSVVQRTQKPLRSSKESIDNRINRISRSGGFDSEAFAIANRIVEDHDGWRSDSRIQSIGELKIESLTTVISEFVSTKSEPEIIAAWRKATEQTYAAIKDGMVQSNQAGYAIACFREVLNGNARRSPSASDGTGGGG